MRWIVLACLVAMAACCGPDDHACTEEQNRALGGMISGPLYPAPTRPMFVTCTRSGSMVNCLGQ